MRWLAFVVCVLACSPPVWPPPNPPTTPYERCLAAQAADPVVANVAQQSRTTVRYLAENVCSDPMIVETYR